MTVATDEILAPARMRRAGTVALLGGAGALSAVAAAVLASRAPTLIGDPGSVARWGEPATAALSDLAAAVCIGALVLATVAIPDPSRAADRARALAAVAGVVWSIASLLSIVTSFMVASGLRADDPGFGSGLRLYVTSFELGQYQLAGTLMAVVATTAAVAALGPVGTAWAAIAALAALVPAALSGHAGDAASHETATSSLGLHLVGVTVWVGGLAALAVLGPWLGEHRLAVVRRYSGLALAGALLVAASGAVNASTRVGTLDELASRYGLLMVVKAALALLLIAAGAAHRLWAVRRLAAGRPRAFTALMAGEVVVMAATIGVAVALSTTPPPISDLRAPTEWTRAEVVAGAALPAAPSPAGWLLGWQPDVLWLTLALAGAAGYLAGVRRLRRRGDHWPVLRTAAMLVGLLGLVWVTSGGPALYGRWSFSTHMVQHMLLAMIVPIPLAAGAPVLLAMRALEPRRDGSRGAREWLLAVVHSRYSQFVSNPLVAAALFTGGMLVFYYSPLFSLALRTHLGHELMITHFLLSGYLFAWVLDGADPGAKRAPYPFRLIVLFFTVAVHAFFGVALMQGTSVLASDYFDIVAAARPWGGEPLADQQRGAAVAWGLGEVPMLVHAIAIAVLWSRADTREARRRDRAADRDGEAEHLAYNAYLQSLAAADGPEAARGAAVAAPSRPSEASALPDD